MKPNVYKRFFKVKPTFVWIIAIVALAASGAGLSLILEWASYFGHYGKVVCCTQFRTAGEEKTTYLSVSHVFYTITLIVVISCCYCKLFKTIKQHKREIYSRGHERALSLNVQEINITKFLVCFCCGLCWGPVAVADLLSLYTEHKLAIPRQVFLFEMYLVFGRCAINPVIYGLETVVSVLFSNTRTRLLYNE